MARIVNEYSVSCVAPDSVPVNVDVPAALFNVIPPGKAPVCTAMETESVAVKFIVPILSPPENEPNEPDPVTHAGTSETVKSDVPYLTDKPSLFSILI